MADRWFRRAPDPMRTLGTQELTPAQTWAEIQAFVNFCREWGIPRLEVEFGWGCRPPSSGKFAQVEPDALVRWIEEAVAAGHYTLGEDNLHLRAASPRLEFLLCHEGDLHFTAENHAWVETVRDHWQGRGYRVWGTQKTANNTPPAPTAWAPAP